MLLTCKFFLESFQDSRRCLVNTSGGVAALNHRLIAAVPPGQEPMRRQFDQRKSCSPLVAIGTQTVCQLISRIDLTVITQSDPAKNQQAIGMKPGFDSVGKIDRFSSDKHVGKAVPMGKPHRLTWPVLFLPERTKHLTDQMSRLVG